VSLDILKHLTLVTGGKLSKELWEQVVKIYADLFASTAPIHLLTEEIDLEDLENQRTMGLEFSVDKCVNQCVVQLRLVISVKDITEMHYEKIPIDDLMILIDSIESSYRFAQTFNSQIILRYKLWKNGFMGEMKNLPGLLKQEKESLNTYISLLYRILSDTESNKSHHELAAQRLKEICKSTIYDFLQKQVLLAEKREPNQEISELQRRVLDLKDEDLRKDVNSIAPIICNNVLVSVVRFSKERIIDLLGPSLIDLIACTNSEIREQL
jgi:hypothetical protein